MVETGGLVSSINNVDSPGKTHSLGQADTKEINLNTKTTIKYVGFLCVLVAHHHSMKVSPLIWPIDATWPQDAGPKQASTFTRQDLNLH